MGKLKKNVKVLIYLIPLALAVILQFTGAIIPLENSAEDMFYQSEERASIDISIIGIDEETLSKYGPFDQWGREKMAEMIELLTADPEKAPAVIALDIGYFGHKDPDIDDRLVKAVRNAGNVVLTETVTFGDVAGEGTKVVVYEQPFDELRAAAKASGHANVQVDSDGVARHAMGTLKYEGQKIESFDMEIYKAYLESKGRELSEDEIRKYAPEADQFYITYSGKARTYYGSVGAGSSFCKVLEGEYPVAAFRDGIVLIGAYASGMQDNYYTSIDRGTQMNGVEIHANIVDQMIKGNYKTELTESQKQTPVIILWILSVVILAMLPVKFAIPLEIIISALYVALAKYAYGTFDRIWPVVIPPAMVILMTILYVGVNYFTVYKEKKRIIANYGKYLSPEVAKSIADTGEDALHLGGIKKDIAVLFVDIRSFTTLSESLPPERVVEMLNSYLKITTKSIFDNEGTVDKFIGDATMGVFNAPLDLPDYTYKAVCAGLEMAELSKNLDEGLPEDLKGRVGFGVGINCGDAVVGNIGTDFRMEYTAIGDTVNTASRLEGQAKAGCVIISENVYERVKDRILCEDAGFVKLKGKANELHIYRAVEKI